MVRAQHVGLMGRYADLGLPEAADVRARLASRGTRRQLTLASERRVTELGMQLIDPLAQRGWDQVHRHRPAVPIILRWLGDLWPWPSWPRVGRIQAEGGPDVGQRVTADGDTNVMITGTLSAA